MDESNTVDIDSILQKLGRDQAIKEGITPTGRKVGVGKVANTALFRIQFVDEKPGKLPAPYDGAYTKVELAAKDMVTYLEGAWLEAGERMTKKTREAAAAKAEKAPIVIVEKA